MHLYAPYRRKRGSTNFIWAFASRPPVASAFRPQTREGVRGNHLGVFRPTPRCVCIPYADGKGGRPCTTCDSILQSPIASVSAPEAHRGLGHGTRSLGHGTRSRGCGARTPSPNTPLDRIEKPAARNRRRGIVRRRGEKPRISATRVRMEARWVRRAQSPVGTISTEKAPRADSTRGTTSCRYVRSRATAFFQPAIQRTTPRPPCGGEEGRLRPARRHRPLRRRLHRRRRRRRWQAARAARRRPHA